MEALAEAGARRISLGGSLAGAALSAFIGAAREVRERGSFRFMEANLRARDLDALVAAGPEAS